MRRATLAAALAAAWMQAAPARADNPMGYKLLTAQEAQRLTRGGGSLGMDIGRAQQINDGGMAFDVLGVKSVRRGSPAAQAGFKVGDDLIAVDGLVFPSIAAFASYVGSRPPGSQIAVDYIPAGGGPQQAQRVDVTMGAAGRGAAPPAPPAPAADGMSTGRKLAIGAGAVALLGCYEMGCFSRRAAAPSAPMQRR